MYVRKAELDAAELLDSTWWTTPNRDYPLPVDPMELAARLGISIRTSPLPPDESGKILIPAVGDVVITLNERDSRNRQRFTCGHEIGHYRHRQLQPGSSDRTFVDYRDTLAGLGQNENEIYANQFAAAILMPGHIVQAMTRDGHDIDALAKRFGTSTQAMTVRLRNLRLA